MKKPTNNSHLASASDNVSTNSEQTPDLSAAPNNPGVTIQTNAQTDRHKARQTTNDRPRTTPTKTTGSEHQTQSTLQPIPNSGVTKVRASMQTSDNQIAVDDPATVLKQYFGYDCFREGQLEVIQHLINGKSAAAIFPTGGGKSLCYQLPALMLNGLTLVVSPLIALMKDQIDALTAKGINAARLDSTLDRDAYQLVMNDIRNGDLQLLYVAPERFNNERFRSLLQGIDICLFAIDEAHCISEWGHNFRPDYLKLVEFARQCNAQRMLALTATATKDVVADICNQFSIETDCAINTGFYRPNLTLLSTSVTAENRDDILLQLFKAQVKGPTIVYVTLQKTAEQVADLLVSNNYPARYYHAGLKNDKRTEVQDWFIESSDGIVVATIAFGMGIDKSNIRNVFHYNLPKSLENYAQEIGRAGRDGAESVCQLLACSDDLTPLENFIYGDTPTLRAISTLITELFSQPNEFDISLYELSSLCDVRTLVLRTLLTQLELQGYLRGGTPFYANYQFKPLKSSAEILSLFDESRKQFISALFKQAKKNKIWFQIDLEQAAAAMQAPREKLVKALDYLGEKDLLEVKVAGVRNRYTIVKRPQSNEELSKALHDDAKQREQREIERLQQVVSWITLDSCQTSALCERFDKRLDNNCGHCSWCDSRDSTSMTRRQQSAMTQATINKAIELQSTHADVLSSTTELARVLCGLSSPAISKSKLQRHALFGVAESVPYATVFAALDAESPGKHF